VYHESPRGPNAWKSPVVCAGGHVAGLGLGKLAAALRGRVRYLGTPGEEAGGGKEYMAQEGAFDGLDAAMMVHSAGYDMESMPCIAIATVDATYHGVAAQASAMPHRGVNALDALVLAYQGISALRQHIRHTERLHGIITDGGQAANIVPVRAAGHWFVRAADTKDLAVLKKRVEGCFQAGAFATGKPGRVMPIRPRSTPPSTPTASGSWPSGRRCVPRGSWPSWHRMKCSSARP